MTDELDDLNAVRTVVDTLSKFGADTQERVLRWAREKLGLKTSVLTTASMPPPSKHPAASTSTGEVTLHHKSGATDIKTFVAAKNPSSNNKFTATVAYFYRFEAAESNRKDSITAEDLQEACRLSGRARLAKPLQTLVHAHQAGLLDKAGDRGAYSISTVGENLVAMTLPADGKAQGGKSSTYRKPSKKDTATKTNKANKKKSKGS